MIVTRLFFSFSLSHAPPGGRGASWDSFNEAL